MRCSVLLEDGGEEADEGVGFGEEGVVAEVHARLCHCAGSRLPWKQAMTVYSPPCAGTWRRAAIAGVSILL